MKTYTTDLAPWERRNEYFHHIQLGIDVKSQTKALTDAINNQISAQMASASAIIANQERIAEGIGDLAIGLERIENGISGLQATFEWGITEVVWQIEQNRKELKSILEVLMKPLDTKAKERRIRAEEAYGNGWIDDAEEEYLESEKLNKFDFTIHMGLGIIYLFRKIDKNKALEYFHKARKYAEPKSKYYASYALLHISLIERDLGHLEDAKKYALEAAELSYGFAEGYYQTALCSFLLKEDLKDMSIYLAKAITFDKKYCLKIDNESVWQECKSRIFSYILNNLWLC